MSAHRPIKVLFICAGNSCRSIMAEGLLRRHGGPDFDVHSAGTHPEGLDPKAMALLDETGIGGTWARSKSVDEYRGQDFDYVINVGDQARPTSPPFPGAGEALHWGYPDPAEATGTEDDVTAVYRRVFTAIGERIGLFIPLALRARDEAEIATAPGASV